MTRHDYIDRNTVRVPLWAAMVLAGTVLAAAALAGATIAADMRERVAERTERPVGTSPQPVCDTDESCAHWCRLRGFACDGGPELVKTVVPVT